ncbi:MAG: hypothetical protein H0X14_13625, partial [Acidobacteria bacterium]|nr:hypothetical protein [Acidobacteriota bacterium]
MTFQKPTEDLIYQLSRDEDMTGRLWALRQLKTRLDAATTAADEKTRISVA